jgi:hypothetical protein
MNVYIQQIQDICKQNKYTKWYCNIIVSAVGRSTSKKDATLKVGYVEKHHIVPKSLHLGGEKDPQNYVFLTAREHFICHWLLSKMTDGTMKISMMFALLNMRRDAKNVRYNNQITSRAYAKVKPEIAQHLSETMSGRKLDDLHKQRIGIANKGKLVGVPSYKKGTKIGPPSEERRLKAIANRPSTKGIKLGIQGPQKRVTCPHCNKETGATNGARFHFNNCKLKNE